MAVFALCLSCLVVLGERGAAAPTLPPGSAATSETVVYPTGDPAIDVARVQAAVDSAENVLLKASHELTGVPTPFDFGDNAPGGGFVVLGRDVAIRGEALESHRTTIAGGFAPFRSEAVNPVTSSISGIDFVSPGVAALFVTGATGVEFVQNRVRDVVGLPDWIPGISKGQGVWIVGLLTVTGDILIADNLVEVVDAQNGYGFALFGFAADARIERNTITGVNTAGILVGVHTGHVAIDDNHIVPGPQQAPEYGGGNGIIVGNAYGGSTYVRRNTIDCENSWADGILVAASRTLGDIQDHALIESNHVTMHDSLYGGIGLIGSVENTIVKNNRLDGSAALGFYGLVWFTPADIVESNIFIGNNVEHFESAVADVAFDVNTRHNLFTGHSRSALDFGEDNWVTGLSRGGPPVPPGSLMQSSYAHLSLAAEASLPSSLAE